MNQSNDNGSFMILAGFIATAVIGVVAMKAAQEFFLELSVAFHNFEIMVGSFLPMLWSTAQALFAIVMIATTVASGVYFIIKYFKVINSLTKAHAEIVKVQASVQVDVEEFKANLASEVNSRLRDLESKLRGLESEILKALSTKADRGPEARATDEYSQESETKTQETEMPNVHSNR